MFFRTPKAIAKKSFKLDGVLYKEGHSVDYLKWPAHTQSDLIDFLEYENGVQLVASKDFIAEKRSFKKGQVITQFFGALSVDAQFKLKGCVRWEPKPIDEDSIKCVN